MHREDKIDMKVNKCRKSTLRMLAESVKQAAFQTDNVDELEKLIKKIPYSKDIYVNSILTMLNSKLTNIRVQTASHNLRNNVTPEIHKLTAMLASGDLNLEEAQEIITEEANKRMKSSQKSIFKPISQERHKAQVQMQIRALLEENSDTYKVQEPIPVIYQLVELLENTTLEQAFRIVVENLIGQRRFDEAIQLCQKAQTKPNKDYEPDKFSKYLMSLQKHIKLSNIGFLILDKINHKISDDDDITFLEMLQTQISNSKISKSQIPLGRNKSKTKVITLDNIWTERNKCK